MEKKNQLFYVNALILVLLGAVALLGLILTTAFPEAGPHSHGQAAGGAFTFLGVGHEAWADLHKFIAIAFVLGVCLHIYLNWSWVHNTVGQRFGDRARVFLLSLLGGSVTLVIVGWILLLASS